jgi:hypothetical protein
MRLTHRIRHLILNITDKARLQVSPVYRVHRHRCSGKVRVLESIHVPIPVPQPCPVRVTVLAHNHLGIRGGILLPRLRRIGELLRGTILQGKFIKFQVDLYGNSFTRNLIKALWLFTQNF